MFYRILTIFMIRAILWDLTNSSGYHNHTVAHTQINFLNRIIAPVSNEPDHIITLFLFSYLCYIY